MIDIDLYVVAFFAGRCVSLIEKSIANNEKSLKGKRINRSVDKERISVVQQMHTR